MATYKEIRLKVGDLTSRDEFGKGIARLDKKLMKQLGVKEGDIIQIEGKKKTGVIAVRPYPSDTGLNIIRMDELVRKNTDAYVGDFIKVSKVGVKDAKKVILAPAQKGLTIHMQPNMLGQNLFRRPMRKGDIIVPTSVMSKKGSLMDLFGSDFDIFMPFGSLGVETKLAVVKTVPEGIIQVTKATEFETKPSAINMEGMSFVDSVVQESLIIDVKKKPDIKKMKELKSPEDLKKLAGNEYFVERYKTADKTIFSIGGYYYIEKSKPKKVSKGKSSKK